MEVSSTWNQEQYGTAAGFYYTKNDVKAPFCMTELSSNKIIEHHLHVDNNKGELEIGYEIIIGHDLMVQLGL